jgi:YVTN family beta-propeller protein
VLWGAGEALALPAPGPLRFISPTPANLAVVTTPTVGIRLDAACTVDPQTLAVTLGGVSVPQSAFLPFGPCTNGRIASQTATVAITLPNGSITSGPPGTISAGDTVGFTATSTGDGTAWNFDGGAEPAFGPSVSPTFNPAGTFEVSAQARADRLLAASALDGGNLVAQSRTLKAADPTPATMTVVVEIDPDVDFVNWESGQVHPIALSAAGDELYALNTPDARLAIFAVSPVDGSLSFAADVPVGIDPVSLAVRPGTDEIWVVNHLSDTVSIVDASDRALVATIAVGDEPTDIVFASGRAFVSLAGNEDRVRVYNASTRALLATINIFGDDPRALATNATGTEVYAVVLESGNQSTILFDALVNDSNCGPNGPPAPNPPRTAPGSAPDVGLIVQRDPQSGNWEDEIGRNWSGCIDYTMPDNDVFVIDADAGTPSVIGTVSRVGTTLTDVVARPGTNHLWVANTDARNLVRFEPNLRGHLVQTRVTVVNAGTASVSATADINAHINYGVTPGPQGEIDASLAHPGDGVFTADGNTFYLTALGSAKVGVLNGAGAVTARIDVGEGPSGVALREAANRLYVLNRFESTISVVNTATNTEIDVVGIAGASEFDPSPAAIVAGRRFLYDGRLTSGHGDTACATCHILGNFDNLAWDLGDPTGSFLPYSQAPWVSFAPLGPSTSGFDPMKGPMTTQTLRGLENLEPFHWRGDRMEFQSFNPAFVGLMGMEGACEISGAPCAGGDDCPAGQECLGLSLADMDAFTDFIMTVRFPPNPFRTLDNSLPTSIPHPLLGGSGNPTNGQTAFINQPLDAGVFTCNLCHALPTGTSTNLFNGAAEGESQDFKIPHLRNMYEKIGFEVLRAGIQSGNPDNVGASSVKAGFGFIHDGSVSLTEFLAAGVFQMTTQQERDQLAFMMSFPTETVAAVGAQQTVTAANKNQSTVVTRIGTLVAEAEAGDIDLVAKGTLGGVAKGYVYDAVSNNFVPDSVLETPVAESTLRAGVVGADVLTYTGVPPGAGVRMGIDRDRDTWLDRTESSLGFDPADPNSNPWGS